MLWGKIMSWLLQIPNDTQTTLLTQIQRECRLAAGGGGAAFAFATRTGVQLLIAEEGFQNFLGMGVFRAVIGLDAITDIDALEALRVANAAYPNFVPMLFLHNFAATCFH